MARKTVYFKNEPKIIGVYSIAGPKESEGSFGKYIKETLADDLFGETTFEKAECKMLSKAIKKAIEVSGLGESDINAMLSGDLLNQIISASFAARDFEFSYIGLYNACSTFSEALALSAALIDGGYFETTVSATGSHFATAERQYRYPLELGSTRPPQSQWTVTGAGAAVVSSNGGGDYPKIVAATFGKVVDFGVTDANNMGCAMAPACADTLETLFMETKTKPNDYDLILSGDLGLLGSEVLLNLCRKKGFDISFNHADCGEMIYNLDKSEYQGGSGAGCSAVVFTSLIYEKLKRKEIKKMIFIATGALLSTVSAEQGESIPGVAHAVILES